MTQEFVQADAQALGGKLLELCAASPQLTGLTAGYRLRQPLEPADGYGWPWHQAAATLRSLRSEGKASRRDVRIEDYRGGWFFAGIYRIGAAQGLIGDPGVLMFQVTTSGPTMRQRQVWRTITNYDSTSGAASLFWRDLPNHPEI